MSNRLAEETSPYLLQHASNPVDWYPWCDEAFRRAADEQKPVFLSVGYSACHWCHVMERESFEDESIAALLNEHFIAIKVDREERPDVDQLYMTAVQLLTGRGGWPMSVFLTPERRPFFGGTYWPPRTRANSPGFVDVLRAVLDAWQNRRSEAEQQSEQLTAQIAADFQPAEDSPISEATLENATLGLQDRFDRQHGGFGGAPKFPHVMDLQLLLRSWRRTGNEKHLGMVTHSLRQMARGGIYDHLGGGFARYSVDARWLVPHFEKMLYDNGLLASLYLEAFQVTGEPLFESVVRETLGYIIRDMQAEHGGYCSAEDADSEGVEGKFYVWTPAEIREVLGDALAERFSLVYGVTENGNFEGKNILYLPQPIADICRVQGWEPEATEREMARARQLLLDRRSTRVRPGLDDKVQVNWNALVIDAMARAGATFQNPAWLDSAERAARFIVDDVCDAEGRLFHSWCRGRSSGRAFLDDYAYWACATLSLYEATRNERWLDAAVRAAEALVDHFHDPVAGGFFYTADDHETLIARKKDFIDSSIPSGNGAAAETLLRLGKVTGRHDWVELAEGTIQAASGAIERAPAACARLMLVIDMLLGPFWELVIVADQPDMQDVTAAAHQLFLPARVIAGFSPSARAPLSPHLESLFAGRVPSDSGTTTTTLFVCQGGTCQQPIVGPVAAKEAIARLVAC